MTNRDYIFNYLDQHFYLKGGDSGYKYIDRITNDELDFNAFSYQIDVIFGKEFKEYFNIWVTREREKFVKRIHVFLDMFYLVRGSTDWYLIDTEGNKIDAQLVLNDLYIGHGRLVIDDAYEQWVYNKKVENTEKLMGL